MKRCSIVMAQSMTAIVLVATAAAAAQAQAPAQSTNSGGSQSADASQPADASPSAKKGGLLEEIVVTGRHDAVQVGSFRGARIIDTPLTVAVIGRDTLNQQIATNLGDALKNTAGVNFSQVSPAVTTNITIRGIAVENRTNYRLDGGLPVVNLIDMPIEAYERVEVLKGVSSLYYGFTSPAGIVNLVAKRATHDPVTVLELTGNSGGGYGVHADVGRMNDAGTLGFRVNIAGSDPQYGVDRTIGFRRAATVALDAKPTDTINLRFDGQFIHKDITEPALIQLAAVNGVITVPKVIDPSRNFSSKWMKTDATEWNVFGHADWRFLPNWQLTLEGGESRLTRDRQLALIRNANLATGASTLRVTSSAGAMFENKNLRGEIAGGFKTGPIHHQLSLGVTKNIRSGGNGVSVNKDYAYNIYTRPELSPVQLPIPSIPNFGRITDVGYYVFDTAKVGSFLDVLGGVRRTNYKDIQTTAAAYRTSVTSLSGGVVVKPVTNLSLYASYIEGLEEGGVATNLVNNPGAILQPNKSKQKEAGIKWAPKSGMLATVSFFDINRASSYVNQANYFVQDGRTVYRGIEASFDGHISRDLSVILSGMYLHARQKNASDQTVLGKAPENTPTWTASAFVNYAIPVVQGLSVNGGAFYSSKRAVNNSNQAWVAGYTTFSAGGAYETKIDAVPVTFRVSADNLTNKHYYAATGANLLAYGLPRLVKFSMAVSF